MKRIHSIDIVRGVVMIIMALDHTRDLFHENALIGDPTDLTTTTPALFFTRWVTHLCAPSFVFLSGVSAYLSMKARSDFSASRNFLIRRGLWLVILELTIVNFGIWFDIHFRVFLFQVIGAIGISFVLLGLLLKAGPKLIGIIGLIILFCHNLLALIPASPVVSALSPLFSPLFTNLTPGVSFFLAYPPIPWLGLMLAGFGLAPLLQVPPGRRKRIFVLSGLGCIVLFLLLRFINVYGDPVPWSPKETPLFTFLSFVNVTKYPPSLQFDLVTIGIMFLMLYVAERLPASVTGIPKIYGRVPLFYYLIHWYVLHVLMFVTMFIQGFSPSDLEFGFNFGRPKAPSGLPLWGVYLVWISVVAALFPLCRWYSRYKDQHRANAWLRYL